MGNDKKEQGSVRWGVPVFLAFSFLLLAFDLISVFGSGTSVSVTGPANWTVGLIRAAQNVYSQNNGSADWTITGSSDGYEDISATVASNGSWVPGATSGTNTFVMQARGRTSALNSTTPDTLASSLAPAGSFTTALNFTSPDTGSEQGNHTMTVTLTAGNYAKTLTYPGATHTEPQCTAAGGTVFIITTGLGDDANVGKTMCKITGTNLAVPGGWAQAANWQKYPTTSWGGDSCGHGYSDGPNAFSNSQATGRSKGAFYRAIWMPAMVCTYSTDNWVDGTTAGAYSNEFYVATTVNPSTNRTEVGIK